MHKTTANKSGGQICANSDYLCGALSSEKNEIKRNGIREAEWRPKKQV